MIELVIHDSEGTTSMVPSLHDEISIGRGDGNVIRITGQGVSRHHARLVSRDGTYIIEDLGSGYGVAVNGKPIEDVQILQAGDEVAIGDCVIEVRAHAQGAAPLPSMDGGRVHAHAVPATVVPTSKPPPMALSAPTGLLPTGSPEPLGAAPAQPHTAGNGHAALAPVPHGHPEEAPDPTASLPARLVMLGDPSPGEVFPLNDQGPTHLGRSERAEVPINHRSVSREHAEIIRERDAFLIVDVGSSNGVVVNGMRVQRDALYPGDVIQLGQVVFKFIGAQQTYVFNPAEAAHYAPLAGDPSGPKPGALRAVLLLGAAAIVAALAVPWEDLGLGGSADSSLGADQDESATFMRSLSACRTAIADNQFAAALGYANQALTERPGSTEAAACLEAAQKLQRDDAVFQRGRALLQEGKHEAAYKKFTELTPNSPMHTRPEVELARDKVAAARLAEAGAIMGAEPGIAIAKAEAVKEMPFISEAHKAAAIALVEAARHAAAAGSGEDEPGELDTAPATGKTSARAVAAKSTRKTASSSSSKKSDRKDSRSKRRSSKGDKPIEAAKACLAKGDNNCVLDALKGRAHSESEIAMLVETYLAVGKTDDALKEMARYVKRFPTARRAARYRGRLDRHAKR
ncbi:MAG: FHA domain-containing protein [Myxococcales bacterium]|nr:FHA domain-containing protein [Myxococcales bacterium]MDD9969951.1 FHA domain-containing protein [Myxococcales bacterium]